MKINRQTKLQLIRRELSFWINALQHKELCRLGISADRLKRTRQLYKAKGGENGLK